MRVSSLSLAFLLLAACGGNSNEPLPFQAPKDFYIGGTVSGLANAPVVLNNYGELLTISANGAFVFKSRPLSGTPFDVVVQRQPVTASQRCTVNGGTGTVAAANVTDIRVECAATYPRFVYAYGREGIYSPNAISMYRLDPDTGQLALNGYVVTPQGPEYLTVHPAGLVAQLSSYGGHFQSRLTTYAIDAASGGLSVSAETLQFSRGIGRVFEPRGRFLYSWNENFIGARRVDPATGEALGGGDGLQFPGSTYPTEPTFDPAGHFAYLITQDTLNEVSVLRQYSVDQKTGGLIEIGQVQLASFAGPPKVDSSGHLYVDSGASAVRGFQMNSVNGLLTEIPGSPFAVIHAGSLLIEPSNRFAYVTNDHSGGIDIYAIDGATGALSAAGSAAVAGEKLTANAVDPTGRFLFATEGALIFAFHIDRSTGALTEASRVRCRGVPETLQFVSGGAPSRLTTRYAYVTNTGDATVSGYSVDPAGALTPLSGSPFAVAPGVHRMTLEFRGRFAFVTGDASISAFAIDAGTGIPTEIAGSPFPAGANPSPLSMSPRGRYLYAGDGAYVLGFNLTSAGTLTPIVPPSYMPSAPWPLSPPGAVAHDILVDPFGEMLYVLEPTTPALWAGSIQDGRALTSFPDDTGALWFGNTNLVMGVDPRSMALGANAEFLYIANAGSNDVSAFRLSDRKAVPGSPFAAGAGPGDIVVHPTGRFAYVANCLGNSIGVYLIDRLTGGLTPISGSPFPAETCPKAIEVDAAGGFLLVLDDHSGISTYPIDVATGALGSRSASASAGSGASSLLLMAQPH